MTTLFLFALLGAPSSGGEKANFSGAWVLDKDKSFSNPPGFEQTMTVTHSGDRLKIEGKQTSARGEVVLDEGYALDGKEADFTPPVQAPNTNAKGKRKAYWLPTGRGFIVEDVINFDSPEGAVTQHITRKWQLFDEGNTLTIDSYIDVARGSYETKRVFVKKKS
jgi:hypothetical protein